MHYYIFNIADYRKDTSHLSTLEHGIYRQLLDWYYLDEKPIPKETQSVLRRLRLGSESDSLALQNVLNDFFVLRADGYHQVRCDVEIKDYHHKAEVNKANGKLGGRPKKTQSVIFANPSESESKANETLTSNHKPVTINQVDTQVEPKGPTIPPCPHNEILNLWREKLPTAVQPQAWPETRRRILQARWKESPRRQSLDWWAGLFDLIADSDFLMGRVATPGRPAFKLTLDWLCKSDNLLKICEGKYANKETQ